MMLAREAALPSPGCRQWDAAGVSPTGAQLGDVASEVIAVN
jgi:hypothetical protein